ncbi:MAG: hypothetical protein B6D64_07140 [Bacteroidetes bacterium 4484_276]|nr:MAG: hypothetical protein B6D64_07140 [Bacteroidetes bacterium 4484_276]
MKKGLPFTFLIVFSIGFTIAQPVSNNKGSIEVNRLMDSLWIHPTSFMNSTDPNWKRLNQHLNDIDILQMNELIHAIYFGNNSFLLNRSHANEGFIGTLNKTSEDKRLKKFHKKIRNGFRDKQKNPNNKVVLVKGDSWFEYPIFLKDIGDYLEKKHNLALYSLANGGDWISNMISNLQYEYDYIKIKPDVFIISGGGNDMVGDYRLSNFIRLDPLPTDDPLLKNYRNYVLLRMINKPVSICSSEACSFSISAYKDSIPNYRTKIDTTLLEQIVRGRRYLNENYYRFLVTIKLEYKILFESLRKINPDRFDSIKIITQGYDYAIPSYKKKFGIQMLMDNGVHLKEPLMMNGINDPLLQQSIIKTIVFEMNEMLIELGKEYNNIYHIDSRGITAYYENLKGKKQGSYWFDELHPKSKILKIIASTYEDVIDNKIPKGKQVINVIDTFSKNNKINY